MTTREQILQAAKEAGFVPDWAIENWAIRNIVWNLHGALHQPASEEPASRHSSRLICGSLR